MLANPPNGKGEKLFGSLNLYLTESQKYNPTQYSEPPPLFPTDSGCVTLCYFELHEEMQTTFMTMLSKQQCLATTDELSAAHHDQQMQYEQKRKIAHDETALLDLDSDFPMRIERDTPFHRVIVKIPRM